MPAQPPAFDVEAVIVDARMKLDAHRAAYAPALAPPSSQPMFTTAEDGAVVDRRGLVVVKGVAKK